MQPKKKKKNPRLYNTEMNKLSRYLKVEEIQKWKTKHRQEILLSTLQKII